MAKLDRLLRLLNLLYHRQAVTRSLILNECKISARSTYRYIQNLSDAGFPVYWDEEQHAYRLNSQRQLTLETFRVDEIVVLAASICCLRSRCGTEYDGVVESLFHKLRGCEPYPIDDVFDHLERSPLGNNESLHLGALLTRLIVQAASITRTPLTIRVARRGRGSIEMVIREPMLAMSNGWHITDSASGPKQAFRLDDVIAVRIATPRRGALARMVQSFIAL